MPPFSLKNLSLFASLYDGWIGQPSRLEQTRNLFSILSFSHRKVTLILLWFYLHFGWPNVGRGWDRNENLPNGREPWSSGYGRRLMSKDRGFKSLHRILDGHFSHLFVVKFVLFVWKDTKIMAIAIFSVEHCSNDLFWAWIQTKYLLIVSFLSSRYTRPTPFLFYQSFWCIVTYFFQIDGRQPLLQGRPRSRPARAEGGLSGEQQQHRAATQHINK